MAELILRPTGDLSTSHTCSSGSAAYLLVNEEIADDDASYVYQTITGTDGVGKGSWFEIITPNIKNFKLTSLEVCFRGKTTSQKSSNTSTALYYLRVNNKWVQDGIDNLTSDYANHSKIYADFNDSTFKDFSETGITGFGIATSGMKGASKNDDYEMRITQAWVKITYEELSSSIYTCSAIAGDGIESASVSQSTIPEGDNCTFTAALKSNYNIFDGWYSDDSYTNLVSVDNPYVTAITSDTTLYAKASRSTLNVSVGTSTHGIANFTPSTVLYGDNVVFTFTPENDSWELYGWYSDPELTQLVSEENPYTAVITEDMTLYPKVGAKRYSISFSITGMNKVGVKIAAVDYDNLSVTEKQYLKTGEYDKINTEKVYETDSANCQVSLSNNTVTASIHCPANMYVAMYTIGITVSNTVYYGYIDGYTWWPYYLYQPTQDASFTAGLNANTQLGECDCVAVAKGGILSTDVTTPIVATKEAIFSAEVDTGYKFAGWYSDESCTQLVSTDNPASIVTPQEAQSGLYRPNSTLTLYAKAMSMTSAIGISLKRNGSWVEAESVYKKVDGAWVADTDYCKTLLSQKDRIGTFVHIV